MSKAKEFIGFLPELKEALTDSDRFEMVRERQRNRAHQLHKHLAHMGGIHHDYMEVEPGGEGEPHDVVTVHGHQNMLSLKKALPSHVNFTKVGGNRGDGVSYEAKLHHRTGEELRSKHRRDLPHGYKDED